MAEPPAGTLALERRLQLLEEENAMLAEGHEDSLLLGLVAEQLRVEGEPESVLRAGLERISMLKDIPLCACFSLKGRDATLVQHFASFTDAPPARRTLELPRELAEGLDRDSVLLEGPQLAAPGLGAAFGLEARAALLVPFRSRPIPEGLFLFATDRDEARLPRATPLLHRVCELIIGRLDQAALLRELRASHDVLEQTVRVRTRDLAERNAALEREIQERRLTEMALREAEARLRTVLDTIPDAVVVLRLADAVFLHANEGFTRLTGFTREDVLGRSALHPRIGLARADWDRMTAGLDAAGRVDNVEVAVPVRDGPALAGLVSGCVVELEGAPCFLSVTRDVTGIKAAQQERDRLAEQLREAQKLEAIGRLAGGVAHDFNNLLTVILSCSAGLREGARAREPADLEDVEAIHAAGERARDLTRQLLAFARRQRVEEVTLDLDEVVRQAGRLLRHVLREDIALEVSTQPGLWPVRCDRGQLEQVLMNLAVNARDAMPGGGRLTIETRNVGRAEGGPGADRVCLSVRDDGVGMPDEVKARVFEPFFTTKGPGEGTGLGLATVYGIVTGAGGEVSVESEPGRGSTFHVFLPRSAPGVAAEADPGPQAPAPGGGELLLVVEDDPLVRAVTVRALRSAGYRVLEASGGTEALALARREPGVALLVTDVVMPGLGGRAVAAAVRALRPGIPVLFVSGYTGETAMEASALGPASGFLEKPFSPGALLGRVRALLDGGAAR